MLYNAHTIYPGPGTHIYKFTNAGNYYYWSGKVSPWKDIALHGVIKANDNEASSRPISVFVNGFEALYNNTSGMN